MDLKGRKKQRTRRHFSPSSLKTRIKGRLFKAFRNSKPEGIKEASSSLSPPTPELQDADQWSSVQCLQNFHLFPNFPLEIRHLVWRATFPLTRRLYISHKVWNDNQARGLDPPVASSINRESRAETLLHYKAFQILKYINNHTLRRPYTRGHV